MGEIRIEPLSSHPELLPLLRQWFETEWPSWYGPGGPGDAHEDLEAYAHGDGLPFGVVALDDRSLCGVAALKAESPSIRPDLSPWAAAGLVRPDLRRKGIGRALLLALQKAAKQMGFERIYCATSTSDTLMKRDGWLLMEELNHQGEDLRIYVKKL